jgi:hypothetical protein
MSMMTEDSLAQLAELLLGRARNEIPNAFTKQAAARPPVKASAAIDPIKTLFTRMLGDETPIKSD